MRLHHASRPPQPSYNHPTDNDSSIWMIFLPSRGLLPELAQHSRRPAARPHTIPPPLSATARRVELQQPSTSAALLACILRQRRRTAHPSLHSLLTALPRPWAARPCSDDSLVACLRPHCTFAACGLSKQPSTPSRCLLRKLTPCLDFESISIPSTVPVEGSVQFTLQHTPLTLRGSLARELRERYPANEERRAITPLPCERLLAF